MIKCKKKKKEREKMKKRLEICFLIAIIIILMLPIKINAVSTQITLSGDETISPRRNKNYKTKNKFG